VIQENLLYSILEKNDATTLFLVKDVYLTQRYAAQFLFVKDYYATYGKLPDIPTVEAKFSISLNANGNPATYWLKELVDKHKEGVVENAILASAKNKKNAINIFQDAIVEYNSDHEMRVVDYGMSGTNRISRYEEIKQNGGISYLSCGNADFDEFSMGYKKADLWTLAGREGLGKTWLLLQMAKWLDTVLKLSSITRPILIVSCEMDNEELSERLDCMGAKIPYGNFLRGQLTQQEELRYDKYLSRVTSNIKIVDDCVRFSDVENYMAIYQPCAVFLDGSHNLSDSYDWKDIATLTSQMKRATRVRRTPIINTTHIKGGKGKSDKGGEIDDLAYSKGYTRDSDIVAIMYADEAMELKGEIGLDTVKIRRGTRNKIIYKMDFSNMDFTVVQKLTGVMSQLDDDQNLF